MTACWTGRSRIAATLLALLLATTSRYRVASPGYEFHFPRDHFSHSDFKTEWWYYTGNLRSADGRRFGFELTFFRNGIYRRQLADSPWALTDIYHAHLALSDISGRRFYHLERTNRSGPGLAGASQDLQQIWNGNWRVQWTQFQKMQAIGNHFDLRLTLDPQKPPVINGIHGISQKAASPGHASHYISFTRLRASGLVSVEGRDSSVEGLAWMDHEFFTAQLDKNQSGWDWLCLQLNDNTELMLYRLRRTDGTMDPFSAGTYVDSQGKTVHLSSQDFSLIPGSKRWTSKQSGATYPISWNIQVPGLGIVLELGTELENQEITSRAGITPNYWEGAIRTSGKRGLSQLGGVGYLEMTGYDKPIDLDQGFLNENR